jgi:hypothetical protein
MKEKKNLRVIKLLQFHGLFTQKGYVLAVAMGNNKQY